MDRLARETMGAHPELPYGQALKVAVHGSERFDYIDSVGREVYLKLNRCAVIHASGGAK